MEGGQNRTGSQLCYTIYWNLCFLFEPLRRWGAVRDCSGVSFRGGRTGKSTEGDTGKVQDRGECREVQRNAVEGKNTREMQAKCGEGECRPFELFYLRLFEGHLEIREMHGYLEGAQGSCTSRSMIIFGARNRSKNLRESR